MLLDLTSLRSISPARSTRNGTVRPSGRRGAFDAGATSESPGLRGGYQDGEGPAPVRTWNVMGATSVSHRDRFADTCRPHGYLCSLSREAAKHLQKQQQQQRSSSNSKQQAAAKQEQSRSSSSSSSRPPSSSNKQPAAKQLLVWCTAVWLV